MQEHTMDELAEKLQMNGMPQADAWRISIFVRRKLLVSRSTLTTLDFLFSEWSNGRWTVTELSADGSVIVGRGCAHWGGEAPPERTGRTLKYTELS